jgi:hypothetical protein
MNPPQQSSILTPMALHNREFPVHRNEAKVEKKVPSTNCQQSIT